MRETITGRITLNLIAGIVITIATVVGAIFWMAARQNEQAAQSTETMVMGGVEAMTNGVRSLANDYGWWEDAYDAYLRQDDDWWWANVGSSVVDTQIADIMTIISPEGSLEYGWVQDQSVAAGDVITPEVIGRLQSLVEGLPVENLASEAGYIDAGGTIYLIAVSRITPVSRAPEVAPESLPIYLAGFTLTPDRLRELGKTFLIDDLSLAPEQPREGAKFSSLPIIDLFGKTVDSYVWTPPTPGYAVLRNVLLPITVALALFCVVAFAMALRARRIAIALTDREKEAVIAARTDSMTNLVNRTGFTELLDSPASREACAAGHLAVVYMDINGFKVVNDSIGHHGGDELVKALAQRVASVLPEAAQFARIGGDEFAVVMMDRAIRDSADKTAAEIVRCLDQPFTIHGFEFHVTVAVGYAIAEGAGLTPSEVVRRADIAMYQAKNSAEREAQLYNSTMETGALEKKQIETSLRRALEAGELTVFYQPVVRSSDLSIAGVESLVRWESKELGAVSPSVFVPVAEETGLIHDLGRFVIDRVCRDAARWPGVRMAINVSPVQLRDPEFADELLRAVKRHNLLPAQIELELTEGILVNNPAIARRMLSKLKEMGFTLSLDDFGTGFSSIGYLRQFPFDILKIDRSFVRDIGLNATANALIQSLVSLGDAMDLLVIAEGIENEDQLKLLRLVQCEFLQGFLISRPLPAEDFTKLLEQAGEKRRITLSNKKTETNAAG